MTADDITAAVAPEVPQPQCVSCHGQGSPVPGGVFGAVERLRSQLVGDTATSPMAQDMLAVLEALERHHA
jgi:hypothetical protein